MTKAEKLRGIGNTNLTFRAPSERFRYCTLWLAAEDIIELTLSVSTLVLNIRTPSLSTRVDLCISLSTRSKRQFGVLF